MKEIEQLRKEYDEKKRLIQDEANRQMEVAESEFLILEHALRDRQRPRGDSLAVIALPAADIEKLKAFLKTL